jgi:hypothetical protein
MRREDATRVLCIVFRKPGATIFLLIIASDFDIKCVRGRPTACAAGADSGYKSCLEKARE